MTGIKHLAELLKTMQPILQPDIIVFCTVGNLTVTDWAELQPLGTFREAEGVTLILNRNRADAANLHYSSTFRQITLTVHSSLDAVGLTAAISRCLADKDISANVVAAYHHDHVFVPAQRADEALQALLQLSAQSQ